MYKVPVINYKPVEMTPMTGNHSKLSRAKLNVVNLDLKIEHDRAGTKMTMNEDATPGFAN
jgi:hypothetical protein